MGVRRGRRLPPTREDASCSAACERRHIRVGSGHDKVGNPPSREFSAQIFCSTKDTAGASASRQGGSTMSEAVFYFGGYHASHHDIDAWLRSARTQKPAVEFIGFPWPKGASSGAHSAVSHFSKRGRYDAVIDDIQGNGADTIYIVGHSSGCAIANAVDAGLDGPRTSCSWRSTVLPRRRPTRSGDHASLGGHMRRRALKELPGPRQGPAQGLYREELQDGVGASFFPGQCQRQRPFGRQRPQGLRQLSGEPVISSVKRGGPSPAGHSRAIQGTAMSAAAFLLAILPRP